MNYEQKRVERLKSLDLLDTVEEAEFNDIVKIASSICGAPIALISLIDERRQWFKACFGLTAKQSAREIAFCDHTIRSRHPLIVKDATTDPRFQNNSFVVGQPKVRFYAGIPLWTHDDYCIGSLCVIDLVPRDLSSEQLEGLTALARQLMRQIEARSALADKTIDEVQLKRAQVQLRDVTKHLSVGVYHLENSGRCSFVNDAWVKITGVPREAALGYGYLQSAVEEDRLQGFQLSKEAAAKNAPFSFRGRLRLPDGRLRSVDIYSEPDSSGGRAGCVIDVTEWVDRVDLLEKELLHLRELVLKKAE